MTEAICLIRIIFRVTSCNAEEYRVTISNLLTGIRKKHQKATGQG